MSRRGSGDERGSRHRSGCERNSGCGCRCGFIVLNSEIKALEFCSLLVVDAEMMGTTNRPVDVNTNFNSKRAICLNRYRSAPEVGG